MSFNRYTSTFAVEYIKHVDGADASQYVASNYTTWNPPVEWLANMQAIYGGPDRDNAIIVPAQ